MRAAWVHFATTGNPSTPSAYWPSFGPKGKVLSFATSGPELSTDFATRHHCTTFAQNLDKVK
jgi:para-nitrobenzyl esterase